MSVSNEKDLIVRQNIIAHSITLLENEGLKFSVDTLATELKISKKTIYKHFTTKEELAFSIFESIYDGILSNIQTLTAERDIDKDTIFSLLLNMREALFFSDESIFNRYSLTSALQDFAMDKTREVWYIICQFLGSSKYKNIIAEPCIYSAISSFLRAIPREEKEQTEQLSSFISLIFGGKHND